MKKCQNDYTGPLHISVILNDRTVDSDIHSKKAIRNRNRKVTCA